MNTKKLFIIALLIYTSSLYSQLSWNISTGFDAGWNLLSAGGVDAHWVLKQTPGSGVLSNPAFATNGLLWDGNTLLGSWGVTPNCCRWLCPNVVIGGPGNGAGNFIEASSNPAWSPSQIYIYEYHFDNQICCVVNPQFEFTAFKCDDEAQLELNGNTYILPGGFSGGVIPITPTHIQCGTNVLKVKISNSYGAATGFRICGNITANIPNITSNFTAPSLVCFGNNINVDGSLSTGPITQHVWEIAECDEDGNYTNPNAIWNIQNNGMPGAFTVPALPFLQCNKYYSIKLATKNNCTNWIETTKVVFLACPPNANAGADQNICTVPNNSTYTADLGGRTVLNPNLIYSWSPTTGLSNPNSPNPTLSFCQGSDNTSGCWFGWHGCFASETFTLTVTDVTTGCSSSDNVKVVSISGYPQGTISQDDQTWCSHEIKLIASVNCENEVPVTYHWHPNGETTNAIVVSPSTPTQYSVDVANECYSGTWNVNVDPPVILAGAFPDLSSYDYLSTNYPLVIFDDHLYTPGLPYAYNAYKYQLSVWDRNGTLIRTQIDEKLPNSTGFYNGEIIWDGRDDDGNLHPDQCYVWRLRLENCTHQDCEFTESWGFLDDITECDVPVHINGEDCSKNVNNLIEIFTQDVCEGPAYNEDYSCCYINGVCFFNQKMAHHEPQLQSNSRFQTKINTDNSFVLYPNPNTGHFFIQMDSANEFQTNLYIYDVNGKASYTSSIQINKGSNKKEIELSGLQPGIYLLKIDGISNHAIFILQ